MIHSLPKPAIFLDRDGVINIDTGYPYRKQDLILIKGVPQAITRMKKLGFLVIVITNQSGIARGFFTEQAVHNFHKYIQDMLKKNHTYIDAFYFCPYHPHARIAHYKKEHNDRKPNAGMIEKAIKDFNIDRSTSFLIGDKETDIMAAHNASISGYLFQGDNLDDFLTIALKHQNKKSNVLTSIS